MYCRSDLNMNTGREREMKGRAEDARECPILNKYEMLLLSIINYTIHPYLRKTTDYF